MHYIKAISVWSCQLTVQIFGILLGLVIVPIGLMRTRVYPDSERQFTQYNTHRTWVLERLPTWCLWWDNPIDGCRGDKRGYWDSHSPTRDSSHWLSKFWWMAVRNPFNYFKRFVLGCDVRVFDIETIGGITAYDVRDDLEHTGFQFLKCGPFYHLYWVRRWGKSKRGLVVELGNKFGYRHRSVEYPRESRYKYFKGFTFEINPFKDIS